MKLIIAAMAVPVLLALLTWASFRAIDPDAERYDRAFKALDGFTTAEIALHRDVLSARAGLLRNYDPLVRDVNALDTAIYRLRSNSSGDAEEAAAIDRFAAAAAGQEELTERFKSDNALLQNSLAYFRVLSADLSASNASGAPAQAVSGLAAAMLTLTLDTSPVAQREVADRLHALATQNFPGGAAESVQALVAHGRLLNDLLPKTDAVLRALVAQPSKQELQDLRTMVRTRQATSRAAAREYRLLLYTASLFLLGILIYFGLQLRVRALRLRWRAAAEHVIAGISTRLIDAQPHEIDGQIDRALAELAELLNADRAYFVGSGDLTRIRRWCRENTTFPPSWPDMAPAVAARFDATAEGIIYIQNVARLPPSAEKETLATAGARSWGCVPNMGKGGVSAVLGFDALRPGMITQSAELGLFRMALDGIANALWRVHLEQERARLDTSLQQARRMETVGALASGVAHNFNNIVGAILGYVEIAEAQLSSDSPPARNLEEIRRAGERARDLVDQILAFGRRRHVQPKSINIKRLIAETSSLLRVSLPSRIELVIGEVPDAAVVSGQAAQLQQVLLNLCNNGAQAMDQDGRLEIETEIVQIARPRSLTHRDLRPGRYVRIDVSDTGRGMDETVLQHIFEPFFTTRGAGSGLGLATVREIVREHGGAINLWSAPGAGSRFEVWLPCIAGAAPPPRDEASSLRLGNGETVLVIDDPSERLFAGEELLAALGYEPVGFTRADDALAACRVAPKRFDALIVGHVGSAGPALELADAMHAILPDTPIVLAAASADEIGMEALVSAGVSEMVHRPLVSTELASALARCLRVSEVLAGEQEPNA
jgi:signal transduction histidine kinase